MEALRAYWIAPWTRQSPIEFAVPVMLIVPAVACVDVVIFSNDDVLNNAVKLVQAS